MNILAWNTPPNTAQLWAADGRDLVICLADKQLPDWSDCAILSSALACVQFAGANVLKNILPNKTLWLMPIHTATQLHDYFGSRDIHWQTKPIPQLHVLPEKNWLRQPEKNRQPEHVIVIGAGIAGAATARELAARGVRVTVLDAAKAPASAASGNRQGLLYAKISPHPTPQTELLLCGYGYAKRLLKNTLSESNNWKETGVLHLNHNTSETQRNTQLAKHVWHQHLYYGVSASQASELAGVLVEQDGLFWPQGAWVNPRAWVAKLLDNPLIQLKLNHHVLSAQFDGNNWQIHTQNGQFSGSHVVFCGGASSQNLPIIQDFPLQFIRGQTSIAKTHSNSDSDSLKVALSGASYVSPAWDGIHCFGATFLPNDAHDDWRESDEIANRQALKDLNNNIYQSVDFSGSLKGHAAVRCDAHDHLPVVGALGEPNLMRKVYAKLALDKNYRLNAPCPFYPNAFVNTAHGSRGLTTAPICAAYIAALICNEPLVLSKNLQHALNPNRLIIRQIVRGLI